jgi:hypothetical protein
MLLLTSRSVSLRRRSGGREGVSPAKENLTERATGRDEQRTDTYARKKRNERGEGEIEKERGGQRDREEDRETERQDRETERQTKPEKETEPEK